MNKSDVLERGEIYYQLTQRPEWQIYIKEINQLIDNIKESIVGDLHKDRMVDKGIVSGLRRAINLPESAIKEMQETKERNEDL